MTGQGKGNPFQRLLYRRIIASTEGMSQKLTSCSETKLTFKGVNYFFIFLFYGSAFDKIFKCTVSRNEIGRGVLKETQD